MTTKPGPAPRAMVQNHCKQIKTVLSYLLPGLQSQQERERKTAILVLIEVGWGGWDGGSSGPQVVCVPPSGLLNPRQDAHLTHPVGTAAQTDPFQLCRGLLSGPSAYSLGDLSFHLTLPTMTQAELRIPGYGLGRSYSNMALFCSYVTESPPTPTLEPCTTYRVMVRQGLGCGHFTTMGSSTTRASKEGSLP